MLVVLLQKGEFMIKSFDVKIPIIPMGKENTDEINKRIEQLGVDIEKVISIVIVTVNPNPLKYIDSRVQRVYYKQA